MKLFEHDKFLKLSDDIIMEDLVEKADKILETNRKVIKSLTKENSFNRAMELMALIDEFQDLRNKAITHNYQTLANMCEVYIMDLEHQMGELRNIYMFGE